MAFFGVALWFVMSFCTAFSLPLVQPFIIAKGLSAKQSSYYSTTENPGLAIDGNTGGTYISGVHCFHVQGLDLQPWWMVDMELSYLVYGARVWNRLDDVNIGPQRFTQVRVGVTSNPAWKTFDSTLFNVCMYYTGVPTVADNPINFTCSRPIAGRYLAVYKDNTGLTDLNFHFCEIDILAISDRSQASNVGSKVQPSFSASATSQLVNVSLFARSDMECMQLRCAAHPDCNFVLYRASSQECWLFSTFVIHDSFRSILGDAGATFIVVFG